MKHLYKTIKQEITKKQVKTVHLLQISDNLLITFLFNGNLWRKRPGRFISLLFGPVLLPGGG